MKTKLLLLLASVTVAGSLTSCDVYATPYVGGYGYVRPSYYGGYRSGCNTPFYGNRYGGGYGYRSGGYGGNYGGPYCR
jgi:hypothetical protein